MHYNFQRYYDPDSGKYTRIDPIGFAGGDKNLYAYVSNNPENVVDLWGLSEKDVMRICKMVQDYVKKEVEAGRRFKYGGGLNNLFGYKGCDAQRDEIGNYSAMQIFS